MSSSKWQTTPTSFLIMSIISTAKKPLQSLTTLEREKESKKLQARQEELIDEMGQTSEVKARGSIQKYVKEQEVAARQQQEMDLALLDKLLKKGGKQGYQRYLIAVMARFVKEEDIPKKYSLYVDSNDQGIVLGIENTDYAGAFKVIGIPKYDINACKIMAVKLGNTVARLEGHFRTTDNGVILGGKEDLELLTNQFKKRHGYRRDY